MHMQHQKKKSCPRLNNPVICGSILRNMATANRLCNQITKLLGGFICGDGTQLGNIGRVQFAIFHYPTVPLPFGYPVSLPQNAGGYFTRLI